MTITAFAVFSALDVYSNRGHCTNRVERHKQLLPDMIAICPQICVRCETCILTKISHGGRSSLVENFHSLFMPQVRNGIVSLLPRAVGPLLRSRECPELPCRGTPCATERRSVLISAYLSIQQHAVRSYQGRPFTLLLRDDPNLSRTDMFGSEKAH